MARILFLQNIDYEFLGPMYISSMVKKFGHECELKTGQHVGNEQRAIMPALRFAIKNYRHVLAKE